MQYVRVSFPPRGEARSVACGAGAASDGASARDSRPGDIHDPLRHTLDARDLDPAHECGLCAREDRLVVLGLNGSVSSPRGPASASALSFARVSMSWQKSLCMRPPVSISRIGAFSFCRPRSASSYFCRFSTVACFFTFESNI